MVFKHEKNKLQFFSSSKMFLFIVVFLNIQTVYSQLVVTMDDSVRVCKGLDFSISADVTGSMNWGSLIAYQIEVVFNNDLLCGTDVDYKNSFFEEWTANTWDVSDSMISIAGFSVEEFQTAADSALLFNLSFSVKKDTVCTDSIKIVKAVFYTMNNVIEASLHGKAVISFIHNTPPVIKEIPAITILEDSTKSIPLSEFISDENNSINELSVAITSSEPEMQFSLDTTNLELLLKPFPDWSGEGILYIKAVDPVGLSDSTGVLFSVIALPDPPGPFSLISPEDIAVFSGGKPVNFSWHSSQNVDQEDSIIYKFFLDSDSLFHFPQRVISISDTTFTMSSFPEDGKYFWKVVAFDTDGLYTACVKIFVIYFMDLSSVDTVGVKSIDSYNLYQNRPNPFNCSTEIVFDLPEREQVVINIYNSLGKHIKTITNKIYDRGSYRINWNTKDDYGLDVSSGVYILRMNAGKFSASEKMILIR